MGGRALSCAAPAFSMASSCGVCPHCRAFPGWKRSSDAPSMCHARAAACGPRRGSMTGMHWKMRLPLSSNAWYLRLLELTDALVHHAQGAYPVTQTLMRGPADLAVALRGHQRLALDLYDHPDRGKYLAGRCSDLWIEVAHGTVRAAAALRRRLHRPPIGGLGAGAGNPLGRGCNDLVLTEGLSGILPGV